MKTLSQALALVAVTTMFATAFTTSHFDQSARSANLAKMDSTVQQVVIVGKRMTAIEKAQYDADLVATSAQPVHTERPSLTIAVK